MEINQPAAIRKSLQETVRDYNIWVSTRQGKGYDALKSRADLTGIVYNKLKTHLRDNRVAFAQEKGSFFKRNLIPEDLNCLFNTECALVGLSFTRPTNSTYNERFTVLCELQEQTLHIAYQNLREPEMYIISNLVNKIQSF